MTMDIQISRQLGTFQLNIAFKAHGVLGLLGPSGSGKSKTLQCIAGIETPDRGHIAVGQRIFFDDACKVNMPIQDRRVGYLFQQYALFPNMSVAENIACSIRKRTGRKEKQAIIASVMQRLHLEGLETHRPFQLSGGQQQRVAMARILVNEPDILLLDEPFSALDVSLKEQVMAELMGVLQQFHKDVILVTHNYEEAYRLCSSIAVLCNGQIDVIGRRDDVFAQPRTRTAASLMGCRNIAAARKTGVRTVFVPAWNHEFTVAHDVEDGLCAIGIRDHSFHPDERINAFAVSAVNTLKLPVGKLVVFRYDEHDGEAPPLVWQIDHEDEPISMLGVRPEDILLLYR